MNELPELSTLRVLTEDEAAILRRDLDTLTPDLQERAKHRLARFDDERQSRIFADFADPMKMMDEGGYYAAQESVRPGFGVQARKKDAVASFYAREYGTTQAAVLKDFDRYNYDYGAREFNEAVPLEPERMFERLKPVVQRRRDERQFNAALDDDAFEFAFEGGTFRDWLAAAKGRPGFDQAKSGEYLTRWNAVQRSAKEKLGPNIPLVRQILNVLKQDMGQGEDTSDGADYWKHPAYELRELAASNPVAYEQTKNALEFMARRQAGKSMDKNLAKVTGEGFYRGVQRLLGGAVNATQAVAGANVADAIGADEYAATMRSMSKVDNDLRRIGQRVLDPALSPDDPWWRTMLVGGSESVPTMIAGMNKLIGLPLLVGSYVNDAREQFRERGWDGGQADMAAVTAGVVMAGIERVSELPFMDKLTAPLRARLLKWGGNSLAGRMGTNALMRIPAELLEEFGQDMTPSLVQADAKLREELGFIVASVPAVDLQKEAGDWIKHSLADTALIVLPLALIGAGFHSFSEADRAALDTWTANPKNLAIFGEAKAARIALLPAPERLAAIQTAWQKQDKTERVEWLREQSKVQRERVNLGAQEQARQQREAEAIGVSIRYDGGAWRVTLGDGQVVQVDSAEAAERIRSDLLLAHSEQEAEGMVAEVEKWTRERPDIRREATLTGDMVQVQGGKLQATGADGVTVRPITDAKMLESVRRQTEGMGQDLEGQTINGSNVVFKEIVGETAGQLVQLITVNRGMNQAAWMTFLHERAEANFKGAKMTNAISHAEIGAGLAVAAQALPVEPVKARLAALQKRGAHAEHIAEATKELELRERLQRLASGQGTEIEAQEMAVELAMAEVMGRDKRGGRTGFAPGRLDALLRDAAMTATTAHEVTALGKFRALLRSVRAWLRGVLGTVAGIEKARREGKLKDGDDFGALVDTMLGLEDSKFSKAVEREASGLLGETWAANTSFSLAGPRSQDADYLAAVERGDMETAQRMVDEAAKAAGYDVGPVYHGTSQRFNEFDIQRLNSRNEGPGFYFTTSQQIASGYVNRDGNEGRLISAYLGIKKPMKYDEKPFSPRVLDKLLGRIAALEAIKYNADAKDGFLANFGDTYSNGIQGAINDAVKLLANDTSAVDQISGLVGAGVDAAIVLQALTETTGFDGIKAYGFSNEGSKDNVIYVAFRPSQIKSADPVTYDDDGNVIPLSQRFDPQSNLISYSLSPARRMELVEFNEGVSFSLSGAQDADYLAAVERGDMAEAQRMVDEAAKRAGFTEKAYHGTPNGFFNTFDQKQSPGWYIGIEEDSKGNYEDGVYWFSDSKFNAQTYAQGLFDEGSNPIDPSKSIPVDQKPLPSGTVVKWWPGKGKKPITLTKEQVDSNTLPLEALTPTGKMKRGSQLQVELPNGFAAGGAMFTRRNLGKEPTTPKRALELALDAYNAPLSQRVKSVVIPVFLDIGKSAEEDMKGESFSRMGKRAASYRAKGYDSVKFKNVIDPGALPMRAEPQTSIAVFTPNQIKSADPVTYDDDGNVIPLSQRFDPQSDLISYSLSPARRMELVENRLAVVLKDQPQRRAEIAKNAIAAVRAIAKRYEGISALSFIDPSEEIARLQADRDADIEAVRQERDFEIEGAKEQKAGGEAIENFKRKADAKLAKIKADFDLAKLKLETDANAKNQATLKRLDRSILIQNLATLEAVTRFLPAQVRAKVGGHMAIARLTTDEARVKEILRRIDKIGPLLESYLKADLSKRIESTLEKAMPERANGEKPKGKLGAETHEFFDRVQRVIDTPLEDVEAEASKLRTQFEKEQDADKQMTLLQELSALEVFGGTFEKSAAELEEIAGILEQAYKNGRDFWKGVLEQRRGSDAALRDLAFAELDNLGRHSDQQKGANKKRGKFSQMARALFSFRQILKSVFGRNSRLSDHFADQQTKAEGAYRDGVSAVEVALHGQLAAIVQRRGMTKGGGKMEARRMVAKLMREWTTERNVNVRVMEGRKVHKDSMSLDDARQALADENKAWSKSQRDEMQEQIDDFDIASFIGSRKGKKKVVAWTVVEDSGTESTLQLTQAEAAYILAIDAQTDLRDALRNTGGTAYTDDSIADIMAALDPDVLAVKDWMVRYLEADHKPLSKAYSDLHGVNLPHIPNYFHALFTHDGNTLAPELGGAAGGSLMQNGWTRQRKKHAAQLLLDFEQGAINIFTVFMRHVPQVEHWKAYSPLVREMKSVINSGMVQNAIKAKVGGSDLDELNGWLGAVEMGGVQDAKLNQAFSDFIRKRIGAKSASILGFRLSTLLVNTTGALNTALDTSLPMREILRSYGRVTVGKGVKSVGEVLAMPVIQRRISQGGNITANYIKSLSESGDINFLTFDVNQAAMEAASMVDAKSSAVALAAAYDAHYRQAKKSGADDASAHQYAEEATERTAQKVLQPLELGAKGRLELSTNPWWKLVSMFMSETRQKLALEIEAFTKGADGKIDWRRAGRVAMVNHLVIGTAVWLMRSIARDMLTSSEGDDDPAWEWENWLSCVICGPLAGMPLIGTALESTISYALQGFQYNSGTNPVLDGIQSMTGGARQFVGGMGDILTGNLNGEEIEDTLKGLNKLFGGIAVIYGTPAFTGTAVASNVVTQAWQAYNNLLGEE